MKPPPTPILFETDVSNAGKFFSASFSNTTKTTKHIHFVPESIISVALLVLGVLFLSFQSATAQSVGSPCHAHRWTKGAHWTGTGCAVDDGNNAPSPLGIVRCANAADTESGIDDNTTYNPNVFTIVPTMCEDPNTNLPVTINPPFSGQKISWFNFDVRPYAGVYDFQTIATGNYDLDWALYYSLDDTCNTVANGLSGACAVLSDVIACGTDFNGWSPQPFITPIFNLPTNLYLVVWKKGATNSSNDDFDFTFKARYGCGDFCSLALDGSPTVTCNPDGTYTVVQNLNGTSTTVTVAAPGSLSIVTNPSPLVFTTADAVPNVNTGTVTVHYPAGVNYNITFTPSGTGFYCVTHNIAGTAPICCIQPSCSITGPDLVCPGSTTQYCGPVGASGYSWSVTGGTINGATNAQCVNVISSSTCNTSFTLTLVVGSGSCTTTCMKTVMINDVISPVITFCPLGSDLGCNPSGVPAPGSATATDNCGTPLITSSLGAIIPNGCLRTQTRTYTATDGCGNTSTCTQVFTWTVDVTPPVFTFCPPGADLGCNPNDVPAPGTAIATDDCGTPGVTSSLGPVIPDGCIRTQTRTYTATDGCGNTSTCTEVFTWTVDVTAPVFTFCPPGSDLGCNPNGLPAPGAATATDDCGTPGIASSLGSVTPDGCFRSQTRTYTATDGCGNTSTCTQVFTWTVDVTPPVFTFCPPGSDLGCNPNGVPAPGAATATDDCGTPGLTSLLGSVIPDGCYRTQTRTYKATDGCGNISTCTQVFTWTVDVTPPEFAFVPDDYIALCSDTLEFLEPTGDDNCASFVTITEVRDTVPENDPSNYIIIRTFTIADGCGNINPQTEQQIITVIPDNVQPVALVDSVEAVQGELIEVAILNNDMDPNSGLDTSSLMIITDPLHGIATVNLDGSINYTPDLNYIGTDSLYYKICDDGVNCEILCDTAKVYFIIEARTITATAEALCEMHAAYLDYLVETDNFVPTGGVTIQWLDMMDNVIEAYTNLPLDSIVRWPGCVVDMNGQGIDWPGWVYIGQEWVQAPDGYEGVRPQARVVFTVNPSDTLIVNYPLSSPSCFTSPPDIETLPDSGVTCVNTPITINVLVNDSSHFGAVIDPTTLMIFIDPIHGSAVANLDSTITYTPNLSFEGVDTLVYYICDTSTITPVCDKGYVFITVQDTIAPVIICPEVISPIECPAVPTFGMAIATDDCDPAVTVTFSDVTLEGNCPAEYSIVRTWIATDDAGNTASCSRTIAVEDHTSPLLICPQVMSPVECPSQPDFGIATATDDCDPFVSVTFNDVFTPGQCPQEYTVTRTWMATDDCGNTATCSRAIALQDNTPPSLSCPSNVTIECTESTLPIHTGIPAASDVCDPASTLTFNDLTVEGTCAQEYTISRTWTATDACGNSSTCIQVVEVVDSTPPVCMTQDITVTVDPVNGYVLITPMQIDNGSMDSCGQVTLSIDIDSFGCANAGSNLVVLTVTDMCGNTSSCSATVTVEECFDPCVRLNTGVYLEGAATDPNGLPNNYTIPMRTNLNDLRILPGQTLMDPFFGAKYSPPGQPYSIAPWNYPGTEGDAFDSGGDPMMGDAGYPATVVDWVLVGLRANPAGTGGPVCQAAALMHSDGYIEFVAPFECCELNLADSFYIVVEHRNHLIVMSHTKLPIVPGADSSTITYDFRIQQSYEDDPFGFGVFTQKEINPGAFSMYAGNGDQTLSGQSDTDINFDDRSFWEMENGDIGEYRIGDYNLNGDTNFNDRLTWERNNGSFTSVPRD